MQLILWRHARDERFKLGERQLEAEGQAQAAAGADWLRRHYPGRPIWTSAAPSARATGQHYDPAAEVKSELNPSANENQLACWLAELAAEDRAALIWVGHSPWLGSLATLLTDDSDFLFFEEGQILVLDNDSGPWRAVASFRPED